MISLEAKGIGKAYHFYANPLDSLKEWLFRRQYGETFWALRDVSFAIPAGGSLGVIGENGAGKSTLLKLLTGTIAPTCGTIERHGRVSALLELGTGFHPDLSGVDNIRLACATLGLSPKETEQRLPEIVAFAELAAFIERPVKTYSSGMYARLGFAVATSVEPEILIVDEALSVGDQHFRKKSMDRMVGFWKEGKTIIFCSHDMYYVQQVCDLCVWLRHGQLERFGPAAEVIQDYEDYQRSLEAARASSADQVEKPREGVKDLGGGVHILDVELAGDCHQGNIVTGGALIIRVTVRLVSPETRAEGGTLSICIYRNDGILCCGMNSGVDARAPLYPLHGDTYGICCVLEDLALLDGQYRLDVGVMDPNIMHSYGYWKGVAQFRVLREKKLQEAGVMRMRRRWERL